MLPSLSSCYEPATAWHYFVLGILPLSISTGGVLPVMCRAMSSVYHGSMLLTILQYLIDTIALISMWYWIRRLFRPFRCGCGMTFWTVKRALIHMGTTHRYTPEQH